jgi:hypothetical protein
MVLAVGLLGCSELEDKLEGHYVGTSQEANSKTYYHFVFDGDEVFVKENAESDTYDFEYNAPFLRYNNGTDYYYWEVEKNGDNMTLTSGSKTINLVLR